MNQTCIICNKEDEFSQKTTKCIFHCEKDEWFIAKNSEKEWDKNLVKRFWKEVRTEKMEKKDYTFHYFIFPAFEIEEFKKIGNLIVSETHGNFWNGNEEKKIFEKEVGFQKATFLEHVKFGGVAFLEKVDFNYANFLEETSIEGTFEKSADFHETQFHKKVSFGGHFKESIVCFTVTKFANGASFKATFDKDVFFPGTQFGNIVSFHDCKFKGSIFFYDSNLPDGSYFRRTNLVNAFFKDIPLDNVSFWECKFPTIKGRKGLHDEKMLQYKEKDVIFKQKLKKELNSWENLPNTGDYESVENLYQQLKKNFEERRDYETAGDFHIGEMEMRRYKFKAEVRDRNKGGNFLTKFLFSIWNWTTFNTARRFLLYWYFMFSEYGEKPGRVFTWFLLIPIFAVLYFWSFEFENLRVATEFAFTSFIPLLPKNIELNTLTWVSRAIFYFETIISSIIWFLLLISIRRKFKR